MDSLWVINANGQSLARLHERGPEVAANGRGADV